MQQLNTILSDYKMIFIGVFLLVHGFVYFNLSRGIFSNANNQMNSSMIF